MPKRRRRILLTLGQTGLVLLLAAGGLAAHAQSFEELQRLFGVVKDTNPLLIPYRALNLALTEILGTPQQPGDLPLAASPSPAPGYLEKNRGLLSPEVIDYYRQWLPFIAAQPPLDELQRLPVPPPRRGTDPTVSDARTRSENWRWEDFLFDTFRSSTIAQPFLVESTLQKRATEHLAGLYQSFGEGGGRIGVVAPGAETGIGGHKLWRYSVIPGDVKADVEAGTEAVFQVAPLLQDPAGKTATDPERALPPVFVPSPEPVRSGALPGGSTAGAQFARDAGVLPVTDPFAPFLNFTPSVTLDPLTQGVRDILNNFGQIPGALDRFGGAGNLGSLADLFGVSRARNLLGQGGGTSPAPPASQAPEDPRCPLASAQRPIGTVVNTARLLQLPGESWTIAFQPAESFFGIRGTDFETLQPVEITGQILPTGMCVWVVLGGNDGVFVADTAETAFRLVNLSLQQ